MPYVNPAYYYVDHTAPAGESEVTDPNPYNAIILSCGNDPLQIQQRYLKHRETRANDQRRRFLAPDFPGFNIDSILRLVVNEEKGITKDGFVDSRFNLSVWSRPTKAVKDIVATTQNELREVVPDLWCMPLDRLHMTTMEITHSRTKEEIEGLESPIVEESNMAMEAVNHVYKMFHEQGRRYRLVRPMVTFDATGIALSFVPAAGELCSTSETAANLTQNEGEIFEQDRATSHHLRAELWDRISCDAAPSNLDASQNVSNGITLAKRAGGIPVAARYVVPSAHLTIGRYISQKSITVDGTEDGYIDHGKVALFVEKIDELNAWLRREAWPRLKAPAQLGGGQQIALGKSPSYSSEPISTGPSPAESRAINTYCSEKAEANDAMTNSTETISAASATTDSTVGSSLTNNWAENGGEWLIGQERGLELRSGTCWYGGGYSPVIGKGF